MINSTTVSKAAWRIPRSRTACIAAILLCAGAAYGTPPFVGVNAGAPISGNTILFSDALGADIASSGCRFVRINFIGAVSGWDATRLGLYDQIIANARNHNLEIVGIFSNETVLGWSQAQWNENYNTTGINAYTAAYASTAWTLIDRYKNDIKYFEIWNEPSCWGVDPNTNPLNPGCSYIWPRIFANLMVAVYKECALQGGTSYFDVHGVSLVSGGLFAHDIAGTNPASATDYAHNVYSQTDVWNAFETDVLNPSGRRYPWHYFGYHFYLNQGSAVDTAELDAYFNRNWGGHTNDGIRVEQLTHGDTSPILVTEFGWTTGGVGEQGKADNLTATFNWLKTQSFIAGAMWYQWNCCDPNGDWGLTQGIGNHEPAYFALAAQTSTSVPPSAIFSGTPLIGAAPLDVTFTNASNGDIDTYDWDFGDTGSSTAEHPVHTYTVPGVYDVSLTATGPAGSDTETKIDYVEVLAVQAAFSGTPLSGTVPLTVQFTDASEGPVTSYDWSFGDSGSSIAASPQHTYTEPGIYTVSLTVSGGGGDDTETKTDYVVVASNVYDLTGDGVIDLKDYAWFSHCFTGAGPALPVFDCALAPLTVAPVTHTWSLEGSMAALPESISGSDLLNGRIGVIEAGGFHGVVPGGASGGLADLTDGVEGINFEAVLADFPGNADPLNRALQVRYDFDPPQHLDEIRVFAANVDGRVFQNYDVSYSQIDDPAFINLRTDVLSGTFGLSNAGEVYGASFTRITSTTSDPIATYVDALRFVFYPVSGTDNGFRDEFNIGEAGDTDGFDEAFQSTIVKEIDVFEYTGPLTGTEADFDGDRDADLDDYNLFAPNLTGP